MAWEKQDDFTGGEEGDPKTAFNSSVAIIQRLDRIKYSLSSNLIFDNLKEAFNIMREYITTIDFKMTDEQRNEIFEFEEALRLDIDKANTTYTNDGGKYYKFPQLRQDVKERLIELSRVLGRIEYSKGMGMIDKDDPRFAMAQGY